MNGLAEASNAFIYASMAALTVAMVAFAIAFSGTRTAVPVTVPAGDVALLERPSPTPGRRASNIGMSVTWLAAALLFIGVILRGLWADRVPWGNMYEFSITSALGLLLVFLIWSTRRDLRWLGLFVVIAALLTLGLAVTVLYTEAAQLVPALKSYWLIIHVSAAIVCAGAFTVGAGTAGLSLIRARVESKNGSAVTGWLTHVPSVERLRTLTNRVLAFAFPLWTFAVIAGAIWAENAWGRYWGWDPKETWAFITWVLYAAYLHARSTAGWKGNVASWIAILGWISFLINYFGVNIFVNSLHSYAGV